MRNRKNVSVYIYVHIYVYVSLEYVKMSMTDIDFFPNNVAMKLLDKKQYSGSRFWPIYVLLAGKARFETMKIFAPFVKNLRQY